MRWFRVAWATVAVLLVSYAALPSCSEAATLYDLVVLRDTLPGAKIKVRGTRNISVWRATVNTVANCWLITLPTKYSSAGAPLEQWAIVEISGAPLTEAQCYDAPIPK